MRQKFIVGNWKMNTNTAEARGLAQAIVAGLGREERAEEGDPRQVGQQRLGRFLEGLALGCAGFICCRRRNRETGLR